MTRNITQQLPYITHGFSVYVLLFHIDTLGFNSVNEIGLKRFPVVDEHR